MPHQSFLRAIQSVDHTTIERMEILNTITESLDKNDDTPRKTFDESHSTQPSSTKI